jgi:hypothetical protein
MRLPRIPATAGKVFRFVIPITTFSDPVDGNTANLHLELLFEDGKQLDGITWIGFNASKRVFLKFRLTFLLLCFF